MNEDLKKMECGGEQLSALMDGQLQGDDWLQALHCAEQPEGRATWLAYHVVGDALRSTELVEHGASSSAFLARFQQRLAQEPVPAARLQEAPAAVQQVLPAQGVLPQAANASVFRWKMLAGLASLAVVASVGWNSWDQVQRPGGPAPQGTQLAAVTPAIPAAPAAPAPPGAAIGAVANTVAANQAASAAAQAPGTAMLRDPRLDELLAAHKQFGSASALQMPAGFLRNANFEAPAR